MTIAVDWEVKQQTPQKSELAKREIAIFQVVCVAEQAGLGMTWSETPKTGVISPDEAQIIL